MICISQSTEAYTLFSEGKTPIEVAIALNLRETEATQYYKEYWKIRNLDSLNRIHKEIGDDGLYSYLQMYRLIKSESMDVQHVNRLLKIANNDLLSLK
jgi:hypothetical protein